MANWRLVPRQRRRDSHEDPWAVADSGRARHLSRTERVVDGRVLYGLVVHSQALGGPSGALVGIEEMTSDYYDRQGNPIPLMEWAKRFEGSIEDRMAMRCVAETTLPNGRWISTVWLGLDHSFGSGPPLIFETMVFPRRGDYSELDCDRYSTEAQALEGHTRMIAKWSDKPKRARKRSHKTAKKKTKKDG